MASQPDVSTATHCVLGTVHTGLLEGPLHRRVFVELLQGHLQTPALHCGELNSTHTLHAQPQGQQGQQLPHALALQTMKTCGPWFFPTAGSRCLLQGGTGNSLSRNHPCDCPPQPHRCLRSSPPAAPFLVHSHTAALTPLPSPQSESLLPSQHPIPGPGQQWGREGDSWRPMSLGGINRQEGGGWVG